MENLLNLRDKFQRNHSDAQYLIQLMLYSDFLFQKQELSHGLLYCNCKQLLDEVFVPSASADNTYETLIIPDIPRQKPNLIIVLLYFIFK